MIRSLLILSFILTTLSSFFAAEGTKEDELLEMKNTAKSMLYNDPNGALEMFKELKRLNDQYFEDQLISNQVHENFLGHSHTGIGNFHLIATGHVDSAFYNYDVAINHYKSSKNLSGIGSVFNNKGVVLEQLSYQDSALQSYDSALFYYQKEKDLKSCAKTYGNIGNIYIDKGNFPLAQSYYLKSYDCALEIKDTLELAYTYFGLGNIAKYTKNIKEAEIYYKKALEEFEGTGDLYGTSSALFSMANIYKGQLKVDSAYFLYHQTMSIFEEAGYQSSLPQCQINIAVLFNEYYDSVFNFKDQFEGADAEHLIGMIQSTGLDSAKYYLNQAAKTAKNSSNHYHLIYSYIGLGTTEVLLQNYQAGLSYSDSANQLIQLGVYVNERKQLAHLKYSAYKGLNKSNQALKWYEVYVKLKDSLYNVDKAEELIQQKYQFDYDKKTAQDSLKQVEELKVKNAEIEVEKAENEHRKSQITYLVVIAFVLLAMGAIVFQRLKVTQKQKKIIDDQKQEVESQKNKIELQHHQLEETHKEISDSIRYAQRLQDAILPEMNDLDASLKDGFVLFRPKDVVSGDFYWMQKTPTGILFAAADCTGHGVPGAMVSVVCSNALNQSVKEFGLHDPSDILDKTREIVIETFATSGTDVKDGMDIALCKILFTESGANVTFAGANNPLWILRDGASEIEEIKGAKQPIGKHATYAPFPQHDVKLNKKDSIFIFSDGYADQFGGEKGKKMKIKPFKQLLVDISSTDMKEQKDKLLNVFNSWKGDFEQVDDVTIIGVRIN